MTPDFMFAIQSWMATRFDIFLTYVLAKQVVYCRAKQVIDKQLRVNSLQGRHKRFALLLFVMTIRDVKPMVFLPPKCRELLTILRDFTDKCVFAKEVEILVQQE
ncbi:hypothetical protein A0J61_02724 [Choanephora cucurbitarum]|uniref:Uncharacterized protein n=1 Tax=Choanephora cucurbitarum TaxID=101091 RepID=A0A1C7NJG2_9FUNG|nr:hypothetical protein A0J61_02724 [Choanephora cucurbitarum]